MIREMRQHALRLFIVINFIGSNI